MTYMRRYENISCSNKMVQTEQSIYLTDVEEHMLYFIRTFKISILRLCTLCYGVVYNYSTEKYSVQTEPIEIDSDSENEDTTESPEKTKKKNNEELYISASCVDQTILEALHKNYTRPPKTARITETESPTRKRYIPNSIISVKAIGVNTDISGSCHARTETQTNSDLPNIITNTPQRRDMDLSSSRSMDVNPKTFILNRWAQESNTCLDLTSQMDSSHQSPPVSRLQLNLQNTERPTIPPTEYNEIIQQQQPTTQQQQSTQKQPARTDPSSAFGSSGSVLIYHQLRQSEGQESRDTHPQTLLPSTPDRAHDESPEIPIPLVKKVTENEHDIAYPRPKSVFNPGPRHEYVSPHTLYYPPSTHFDRMAFFGRNELGNQRYLPYPNIQQYTNTENMDTLDLSTENHLMLLQKQHQQLVQQQEEEQRYVQGLHHMPNQPQRTSPPQQQPQQPQLIQQMESPQHNQQLQPSMLRQSMIQSQQHHQMLPPTAVSSDINDISEPDREEPAPQRPRIERIETNLRNTRIERPQPAPKTYSRKQPYYCRNRPSDMSSDIAGGNIIVASHMAANNMGVNNMSVNNIAANNIAANIMAANNMAANNMAANNMAANNMAANNMAPNNMAGNIMAANNMVSNNMAPNNMAGNIMAANNMAGNIMAAKNMAGNIMAGNNRAGNIITGNIMTANNMTANNMTANNMTANNMAGNIMAGNNRAGNIITGNIMTANNMTANNMTANNMAGNNIAANNIAANIMATNNILANNMAANNMASNNMAANNIPATSMPNNSQMFQRGHMGQQWPNQPMPSIAMHQSGQHQVSMSQDWMQRSEALHHAGRWPVPGCSCVPCIRLIKFQRYKNRHHQ